MLFYVIFVTSWAFFQVFAKNDDLFFSNNVVGGSNSTYFWSQIDIVSKSK